MVLMHDTAAAADGDAVRMLSWTVSRGGSSGDKLRPLELHLRLSAACRVSPAATRDAHGSPQHSSPPTLAGQHTLRSAAATVDALFPNVVHMFDFARASGSSYVFRTAEPGGGSPRGRGRPP